MNDGTNALVKPEWRDEMENGNQQDAALRVLFGCFSALSLQSDWRDPHDADTLDEFEKWLQECSKRIKGVGKPGPGDMDALREAWEKIRDDIRQDIRDDIRQDDTQRP